jgi:hypothetical protein
MLGHVPGKWPHFIRYAWQKGDDLMEAHVPGRIDKWLQSYGRTSSCRLTEITMLEFINPMLKLQDIHKLQ